MLILSVFLKPYYPPCKSYAPFYVLIFGLSVPTKFFHIISKTARFAKKNQKVPEYKIYVSKCCKIFETFLNIWNIQGCNAIIHKGVHMKYPWILSDLNENCLMSTHFRKILKCQISWKSGQWETSYTTLTDRHGEATSHLPPDANAPTIYKLWSVVSCTCIQTAAARYQLLPNIPASTILNT